MAMRFDPASYGADVESILALDRSSSDAARHVLKTHAARGLFPSGKSPEGAWAGLWLYFSCLDEAHAAAQDLDTVEGSFWHGILHRREPDPDNAAYWFGRVGQHPVFPALRDAAADILSTHSVPFRIQNTWDPMAFIDFYEAARQQPGSEAQKVANMIQDAEWEILFDYCARPQK
jgi:hypothetical protein